jgi:lantibiotic biosynthesis protein
MLRCESPAVESAARAIADSAVAALAAPRRSAPANGSVGLGIGGTAVFLHEAAQVFGDERYARSAYEALRAALEAMPALSPWGLLSGQAGLLLAAHAMSARAESSRTVTWARRLTTAAAAAGRHGSDLTGGVCGTVLAIVGVLGRDAAIEALPPSLARDAYERMRSGATARGVDLGLAHGIAGVLCAAAELNDAETLDRVAAVFEAELARPEIGLRARSLDDDARRTAWCYGALGVALALLGSARDDLLDAAIARLGDAPGPSWRIEGAGICHGTAGAALCTGILAQHRPAAAPVAERAAALLASELPELENRLTEAAWAAEGAGTMVGLSGIGLALLWLLGARDRYWLRFLGVGTGRRPEERHVRNALR